MPEPSCFVRFDDLLKDLPDNIETMQCLPASACSDVAGRTNEALSDPLDFPPVAAAILPGDHVVIALDPNVPQIDEVITGVLKTIGETEAGQVEIVVWDEATDQTIATLKDTAGDSIPVTRHQPSQREDVRFLGADETALPIYVNRAIVDADFVLPVLSVRSGDAPANHDLTGIFPAFADSMTRTRFRKQLNGGTDADKVVPRESHVAWLLGVQLSLAVQVNLSGTVSEVFAGTPDAIWGKMTESATTESKQYSLVIASLDGDAQQQTWANATRAIVAASRFVQPDGVIALWSNIQALPKNALARLDDLSSDNEPLTEDRFDDSDVAPDDSSDGEITFQPWDESIGLAIAISTVREQYRVMAHTQLESNNVEPIGIGYVADLKELSHLIESADSCAVLRSAQFACSTHCKVTKPAHT